MANEKGRSEPPRFQSSVGGAREDRTPDLLNAIRPVPVVLDPMFSGKYLQNNSLQQNSSCHSST
jgi:hypothetical protein